MRARDTRLTGFAKQMRREPTEPEKRLWRHLSNSQLGGFKFRRQAVIGNRIVDFLCPSLALVVEVDGETHEHERDWTRDRELGALGFTVFRVTNPDVMTNMEGVLEGLLAIAQSLPPRANWRLPTPTPPLKGRG